MTETTRRGTEDFTRVLQLPMSPDDVLALFTSTDGVARWWGPAVGSADAGGTITVSFGEYGANAVRVLESGPSRVVWEPVVPPDGFTPTGHTPEWLGTRIEVGIQPSETGTELSFRHVGVTPALACYADSVNGWTLFLTSIETLAATGTGTPYAG
jgi:hypothetical protein